MNRVFVESLSNRVHQSTPITASLTQGIDISSPAMFVTASQGIAKSILKDTFTGDTYIAKTNRSNTSSVFSSVNIIGPSNGSRPAAVAYPTPPTAVKATTFMLYADGKSTSAVTFNYTAGQVPRGAWIKGYNVEIIYNSQVIGHKEITSRKPTFGGLRSGKLYAFRLSTLGMIPTTIGTTYLSISIPSNPVAWARAT